MGMDLVGKHGDESFNNHGWRMCLERAIEFGWTPEGTVAATDFPGSDRGTHLHRRCIKAWTGGQPGNHTESTWR